MKRVTYRDRFVTALQHQADLAEEGGLFQTKGEGQHEFNITALVERVEIETNTRFTAKSPKYLYTKVSIGGFGDARIEAVINHCIDTARLEAGGKVQQAEKRAYMLGKEYNKIVDYLREYSKPLVQPGIDMGSMIYLYFGKGTCAGYASDGGCIVRVAALCALAGAPFSAYVKATRIRPRNYDLVTITIDGRATVITFAENTFRYEIRPETVRDGLKALFDEKEKSFAGKYEVTFRAEYLRHMAVALSTGKKEDDIRLAVSLDEASVKMVCGETEVYLMAGPTVIAETTGEYYLC